MNDWTERLKNEYCELLERYNKLSDALCYLDILHRRLEIAGVNL